MQIGGGASLGFVSERTVIEITGMYFKGLFDRKIMSLIIGDIDIVIK